jgi:hypothetical protein
MLVVATLIGILVAITFPSFSAGLDGLRLNSASDSIVSFLNAGLNRAERRQQVIEITISKPDRALSMRSVEPGFQRRLQMPEGIDIVGVQPDIPVDADVPRHFLLFPGGAIPRIGIQIANKRNEHRMVRVDPITGVPQVERVEPL